MPIPCLGCRKNMSESALVCPHCGARQADRDWASPPASDRPPEPLHVSSEEAAAIIQMRGAGALDLDEPAGPMSLVLPRPEAEGAVRVAEWLLTIAAIPVLVPGFVVALFRLGIFARAMSRISETTLTFIIGAFGASILLSAAMGTGWSRSAVLGLVGLSAGALFGRWLLRRRT